MAIPIQDRLFDDGYTSNADILLKELQGPSELWNDALRICK